DPRTGHGPRQPAAIGPVENGFLDRLDQGLARHLGLRPGHRRSRLRGRRRRTGRPPRPGIRSGKASAGGLRGRGAVAPCPLDDYWFAFVTARLAITTTRWARYSAEAWMSDMRLSDRMLMPSSAAASNEPARAASISLARNTPLSPAPVTATRTPPSPPLATNTPVMA